jgi:predicted Zn-dependent protease
VKFDPSLPEEGINVSPDHPLQEFAVLLGGILAVSAVVVVIVTVAVDRLVPLVPARFEVRWFSDWADGMENVEPDPRAEAMQDVLERLARHWPDNPYPLRVGVIEDEQPNAFAMPGGWIGMTTGLLVQLESENELALVLGHELGHFRNRDHLRGLGRGVALALVLGALGLSDSGSASGLAMFAASLTDRAFDRDQESDADLFGLSLVYAEYGHLAGALSFFDRLPEPEGSIDRHVAHYLATHPLNDDRIDALVAAAQGAGWSLVGQPVPLEIDFSAPVDLCGEAGETAADGNADSKP